MGLKVLVVGGAECIGARMDKRLACEKLGWQLRNTDSAILIEHAWDWEMRGPQ